jgi:plastocyanin
MSPTSMRRTMLCSAALLVISVAGCSKSKDQETSTGGTAPPASLSGKVNDHGTTDLTGAGSTPSVDMELDDNYFGPTFVEVAPGATVKLELKNEGSRQHTVTTANGVDVVVDPGATGEAVLTAPTSGQLDFYCRFHKNTGMQGSVVVTSTASGAGGAPAAGPSSSASSSTTSTTKASSGGYGY